MKYNTCVNTECNVKITGQDNIFLSMVWLLLLLMEAPHLYFLPELYLPLKTKRKYMKNLKGVTGI